MQCFLLRPDGREVMGGGLSQFGAPLRALALGYDCRALRALSLRDYPHGEQSVSLCHLRRLGPLGLFYRPF